MVLTKQSALFNAWKEMNRVAAEHDIPFRCVTQWATHQTGKLHDTLGITLELPNADGSPALQLSKPCSTTPAVVQKRSVRGKKVDKKLAVIIP